MVLNGMHVFKRTVRVDLFAFATRDLRKGFLGLFPLKLHLIYCNTTNIEGDTDEFVTNQTTTTADNII